MLDVRSLRKSFGPIVAVQDVSFAVQAGEIVGLLGPNGAGKTTTVAMIAGLTTPDAGQVLIGGASLKGDADPIKRRVGLVPQDLALYDELSAIANLKFFGALYDLAPSALDSAIKSALDLVGLTERAGDRVSILLLDEPTVGVDPQSRHAIFSNLEALRVQFLLFAAIDLGVGVLLDRQRGLWKRLRSAPISRFSLLIGKSASGAIIALMTLLASFTFAMIVFGVRIEGSVAGFAAVALTTAIMASTFGLLIASLGRTPGGTRGIASLSVLLMVMLGGAWVPTFVFPAWLQPLTVIIPARWAVDGFDAVTWRGLGFGSALAPALVMLGFALIFGSLAISRFRWDEV